MGKEITPKNLREMRAPWWGCCAGRVIGLEVILEQEREALWTAIVHMRRVVAAYDAAIEAPSRHAACLRLLVPPAPLAADASSPAPDCRSLDERVRDATAAMMRLEGWLGYADKEAVTEAKRVVLDDMTCVDPAGLIQALHCVSDGIKGLKMSYRGRY